MEKAFLLAHLSDSHLSCLDGVRLRDFLNKRVCGYVSWILHRRNEHRDEILAALRRDLKFTNPDHIVFTGDLTHLGLPGEFRKAGKWLQSLGTPRQVTVIPGNHDAYVAAPWDCTFALWAEYMLSDGTYRRPGAGANGSHTFPSLRVRGNTALIGISTARPCAPFFAIGSIGETQLQQLAKMLEHTGKEQLLRIILLHHPPAVDTVSWRRRLIDSAALRAVVERHGVELVLHGHAHRTTMSDLKTPTGRAPAIGVGSASALGRKPWRRARYHLCRLRQGSEGWELRLVTRLYLPARDRFVAESENHLFLPRPSH